MKNSMKKTSILLLLLIVSVVGYAQNRDDLFKAEYWIGKTSKQLETIIGILTYFINDKYIDGYKKVFYIYRKNNKDNKFNQIPNIIFKDSIKKEWRFHRKQIQNPDLQIIFYLNKNDKVYCFKYILGKVQEKDDE